MPSDPRCDLRSVIAAAVLCSAASAALATSNTSEPADWRLTASIDLHGESFSGVARVSIDTDRDWSNGFARTCSGTLLSGGLYVLTAAHCMANFAQGRAEFGVYDGQPTAIANVTAVIVNPYWNGSFFNGVDMALLRLDQPMTGLTGFDLSGTNDLGQEVLMVGYGDTTTGGSPNAPNDGDGAWGHYGYNRYDINPKTFLEAYHSGETADNSHGEEYIMDFDDGTDLHNTLQRVAALTGNLWRSDTGLNLREALTAPGDSGAGDFLWTGGQWLLVGVHSWGWQFCPERIDPSCDASTTNTSSYGDLAGSGATYFQRDWIDRVMNAPEPGGLALVLAAVAAMFGAGRSSRSPAAARRRR